MGKPSARKLKKQKQRQQDDRKRKLAENKKRRETKRRQLYPEFQFDTRYGNPEFVELVREAMAKINFDDRTIFPTWEAETYKAIKEGGAHRAVTELQRGMAAAVAMGHQEAQFLDIHFLCHLGQVVFDLIGEEKLAGYLPFNDVRFLPSGRNISVTFRSLLTAKGSGGTVYYSRRKPTLDIDGHPKIVAFSKHAIEQTCNRIKPTWKKYAGLGDVFAFFDQCLYFERCDLYGGQLGFTFFDICGDQRFWQYLYVTEVMGEDNLEPGAGPAYYRVGYCPVVIEGEFVKAKTLLFPGFRGTPEYGAIRNSDLRPDQRRVMAERAESLDGRWLVGREGFEPIKWFHDHGVPQVVQMRQPVFDGSSPDYQQEMNQA